MKYKTNPKSSRSKRLSTHGRNKIEIVEGELVRSVDLVAQSIVNFIKTVLFFSGEVINEDSDDNLMYFCLKKIR